MLTRLRLVLLFFFFSITLRGVCQIDSTTVNKVKQISDSLVLFSQKKTLLLKADSSGQMKSDIYKKFIDTKFTYLSFQRGTFPTGNSASVDLLENDTKLNFNLAKKIVLKNGSTLPKDQSILLATVGAKADLSSGIANIFSGNVPATGTTLLANFSFLPKSAKYRIKRVESLIKNGKFIPTATDTLNANITQFNDIFREKYLKEYKTKYMNLISRWNSIKLQLCDGGYFLFNNDTVKFVSDTIWIQNSKILLKQDSIKVIGRLNRDYVNKVVAKVDSVKNGCYQAQANLSAEKDLIEKQLNDAGLITKTAGSIIGEIESKFDDDYFKLVTDEPVWEDYRLNWLSMGISYTRQVYNTYDNTLSLNKRFDTRNFDNYAIKFSYNWFKDKIKQTGIIRSWYANISYEFKTINSFSDLTNQDLIKSIILVFHN